MGNPVSSWTETGTASGGTTLTVTKAAGGAGTTHFLCGLCCSMDFGTSYDPGTAGVLVKDGTTVIFQVSCGATSQKAESYKAHGGSGPLVVNFTHPIQITEDALVSIVVDPSGSNSLKTDANLWGFTSKTRQVDGSRCA